LKTETKLLTNANPFKTMKQIYFLLFLFFFTAGFAQAPANYYSTATGSGYTLKTQLYNIIKDHTVQDYAGLYITYETSDIDNFFENDGSVLDMYSENPAGVDPYNYTITATQRCGNAGYNAEGDCYNREHIIPQSIFNQASPMVSDAHFITPTDGEVNGIRSNFPHSVVVNPTQTTLNGSKLGASTTAGYTGLVFEPIDEFKGDIARMYFYFATRYQNTVASYNFPMFNNSTNKVFTNAFLSQLIAWHNQDPVSNREIARNNAIYARQNNRNPYIDNPSYVATVWTTEPADTEAPTAATNVVVTSTTSNSATLTWNAATDNVAVTGYDLYVDGVFKSTYTGLTATVTGLLPSTTYGFSIITRDDERNSSVATATVNETTTAIPSGGSGATDLFFSEYIEGSSFNKALEIANFTGSVVNLTGYSIRKQSNGAGVWTAGLNLTGTLNAGAVFVLVDPQISTACFTVANANLSSAQEAFNGNDPMGLFKNGVLIDIIGTFNGGSANFAADVTLRRKSSISGPNTTFNLSAEWDSFPNNTCNGLGAHSNTLSTTDFNSNEFTIYPNPSNGNVKINFTDSTEKHQVQIFSVGGQKVFDKEYSNNSTAVISSLPTGVYIVKIIKNNKSETKKLIVN
jgi:endonuclease I